MDGRKVKPQWKCSANVVPFLSPWGTAVNWLLRPQPSRQPRWRAEVPRGTQGARPETPLGAPGRAPGRASVPPRCACSVPPPPRAPFPRHRRPSPALAPARLVGAGQTDGRAERVSGAAPGDEIETQPGAPPPSGGAALEGFSEAAALTSGLPGGWVGEEGRTAPRPASPISAGGERVRELRRQQPGRPGRWRARELPTGPRGCPSLGAGERQPIFPSFSPPSEVRCRLWGWRESIPSPSHLRLRGPVMAAVLLKARPKVPVSFEDVSVYFTKTEWKLLDFRQRVLYKRVMLENYRHLVSLGFSSSKPHLVSQLERGEGPWVADVHRMGAVTGMQTGDRIKNKTSMSKQKDCPKELAGARLQGGNKGQVAGPSEETLDHRRKHACGSETGSGRGDHPREKGQGSSWGDGRETPRSSHGGRQDSVLRQQGSKGADKRFLCQQCGKSFSRSSNLIKHRIIHSGEKPYECGECGKLFRRSFALLEHQRIHSGEKPYACGECGKTFTRSSNLIKHQIIHSGEKPYECGECGKLFRRSFALLEHQRIHSGERPYACSECGKAFSRSSNLIEHQRTHSGEKPYTCSQCPKAFKGISQLIHHQRIHSGEKPFECKECGKTFRGRSGLSQHRRVHSGEKPYECSECGKTFSRRSNLFKHQAVHSEERPYECLECGKMFRNSSVLQEHRSTHSGQGPRAGSDCSKAFKGKLPKTRSGRKLSEGSGLEKAPASLGLGRPAAEPRPEDKKHWSDSEGAAVPSAD